MPPYTLKKIAASNQTVEKFAAWSEDYNLFTIENLWFGDLYDLKPHNFTYYNK